MTASGKVFFWLGALAAFVAALVLLRAMLLPFVAGMALAYLLDPLADGLQARRVPRALATTLALAAFFVAFLAGLFLFVPLIESQVAGFARQLPALLQAARDGLADLSAFASDRLAPERMAAIDNALAEVQKALAQWSLSAVRGLYESGIALLNLLGLLIVTPVVAWYLLRDWDRLIAHMDAILPRDHAETIRAQARAIDSRLAGFVRGQAMVCLILGIAYAAALQLAGLDYGLLVGAIAGLISFIPFVGSIVGLALSAGFGYLQFGWSPHLFLLAFVFVAGQAVEGYYLTPRLVGNRVGLHPVWVMFALLAGGSLFGFVGVMIAVPVAAAIGVLARFALERYLASRLFRGAGANGGGEGGAAP